MVLPDTSVGLRDETGGGVILEGSGMMTLPPPAALRRQLFNYLPWAYGQSGLDITNVVRRIQSAPPEELELILLQYDDGDFASLAAAGLI